ncbi:hypothetical protein CP960_09825 [Malaciobacter halophilus]|uniref:Histidine kinase n=1 Tax=Malaciobacter halophilus TaxID=197482 RepID=A0A2N1J1I6_9BACT|nr:PAS domain S-box protein [Malaciobacter halophilus]AXH08895.1 PAS sensor-containing signal transduction protein [Malaciobacter halophilus]PKI80352.1 hypothetical protein CP960_09825 [Malaciobacter halophilus]
MIDKSLFVKYILTLFILVLITGSFINSLKKKQIDSIVKSDINRVKQYYKSAYNQSKNISDLIFFNNLLYDKKLIKIFKNSLDNSFKAKQELFAYLENKFYYFKSFGVNQINFYLPNNKTFLRLGNKIKDLDENYTKNSLIYVNSTLKEIDGIQINAQNPSLRFLKPLLDENLNHLATIELGISFDFISTSIQRSLDYKVFFLYKKELVKKDIFKSEQKKFEDFILNDEYQIQNNIFKLFKYRQDLFNALSKKNLEIKKQMRKNEEFGFVFTYKNKTVPFVFIPLRNSLTKQVTSYIVAYNSVEKSVEEAIALFDKIFILMAIFYLIFAVTLYAYLYTKHKKSIVNKRYDDLINAIDKYVIMAETNRNGFITYVTKAFCDISGYKKSELVGKNINILRHPDISKKFFQDMWDNLKRDGKWEGEIKNIDKNGNSYWVKGTIFPRYNLNKKIIGYSSIRVNITDAKQLEKINTILKEDLSNKLTELKYKDENFEDKTKVLLMGKVLDIVSHQWKQPISKITIQLALLNARLNEKSINKQILKAVHDKIEYELKSLSITLNEFKSLFNKNTKSDKYNVYEAIKESISSVKNESLSNVKIYSQTKKDIFCFGNFNEIKQIVSNILKSIIEKNSIEQSCTYNIKLSILEENSEVIIKITHDLKGAKVKDIQELINSDIIKSDMENEDMSLYVAKLLIEKSGAKIWFDVNEYETNFFIKLVSIDRRKSKRV